MTQLNNRVSVGFTDKEWETIQLLKMRYFDKSYAEVVKMLILRALEMDEQDRKESTSG